jgi:nitroreductase/dihydropteridine reductase
MDFKDIVQQRYACRKYEDEKIPEDTIRELLELIRFAVSARNLQPWKIKLVSDKAALAELFGATGNQVQVRDCSHLLVFCADTDYDTLLAKMEASLLAAGIPAETRAEMVTMTRERVASMTAEQLLQWSQFQVFIALGNGVNGAYSLGLGACPMTNFKPQEFARILGLPANLTPTVLLSLGYAADKPAPKRRYSVPEILA